MHIEFEPVRLELNSNTIRKLEFEPTWLEFTSGSNRSGQNSMRVLTALVRTRFCELSSNLLELSYNRIGSNSMCIRTASVPTRCSHLVRGYPRCGWSNLACPAALALAVAAAAHRAVAAFEAASLYTEASCGDS